MPLNYEKILFVFLNLSLYAKHTLSIVRIICYFKNWIYIAYSSNHFTYGRLYETMLHLSETLSFSRIVSRFWLTINKSGQHTQRITKPNVLMMYRARYPGLMAN